jgi:alpha-galactosidase
VKDPAPAWPGVQVEVKADYPVTTAQTVAKQQDGFERLAITLSNQGQQPLKIAKITVRIPVAETLSADLEMVYGGSCMGRTPSLRQNVGKPTANSSSHMYEMVRLADGKYLFAGSLSWRIFLPNFTLKKGAIEIWSDGEGRQLKPGESIPYEQIVLRRAEGWLTVLDQFGAAIALENGIAKLKPADFKGWATWDYYGRVFTAKDIAGNMDVLNKIAPSANMVQIDGGWWTERGDYIERSARPPARGHQGDRLPDHLRGENPWHPPRRLPRGDESSEIFKTHPEYFLHDQDGKLDRRCEREIGQGDEIYLLRLLSSRSAGAYRRLHQKHEGGVGHPLLQGGFHAVRSEERYAEGEQVSQWYQGFRSCDHQCGAVPPRDAGHARGDGAGWLFPRLLRSVRTVHRVC